MIWNPGGMMTSRLRELRKVVERAKGILLRDLSQTEKQDYLGFQPEPQMAHPHEARVGIRRAV